MCVMGCFEAAPARLAQRRAQDFAMLCFGTPPVRRSRLLQRQRDGRFDITDDEIGGHGEPPWMISS